jgi:glycosyltransferase involved in cell wall biosynthesis
MNKIAIITPFKENYTKKNAGAVSLWVKDYLAYSNTSTFTNVFGNLDGDLKPYTDNFINIKINTRFNKNINYINEIKKIIFKKNEYSIIEIHNRPQYLNAFKFSKKLIKIIVFHNNPLDLRGSQTKSQRLNILQIADHLIFVSEWCKKKFFEDLNKKDSYKTKIVYPAIQIPENKIPKKENIIFFSGKLNSAKGYDIFGSSIIQILNQNPNWRAIVAGNESREHYNFKHERLKTLDWLPHDKILNIYKKTSISVVCSRWEEPFGRTAMEASNYGCLTIITDNGGLRETSSAPIILKELTVKNLVKLINFYIKNKIKLKKILTYNFNNKKILLSNEVNKIDLIKNFQPFLYNYSKNIPLRILHISNFDEKNNYRLFNISISNKLSNGFIKNNNNVINFCYRNFYNKNRFNLLKDNLDKKILEINHNYRPNLILLGHFNDLKRETMDHLKRNYKSKIFMWYEDALSNLAKGPDWNSNLNLIEKNHDLIDKYYLTTHPDVIKTNIDNKKLNYLPIPADSSVEFLDIYKNKNKTNDLFFAYSHGVNYGRLRKDNKDERIFFLEKIKEKLKDRVFILGKDYSEPKWNFDYYDELSKSKAALNLSRGRPVKYTSSNRISSLIANGIYTFIDEKTQFNDFFNDDEVGFYKNENDLINKLDKILSNERNLKKFSENGKRKYFQLFDNKIITKNIILDNF